ncbi:MAG: hypothetical protein KDI51_20410, partial [Xanthomonadales bacterium]|nr:hypothetical protein [Xanthomonadales bacterium]
MGDEQIPSLEGWVANPFATNMSTQLLSLDGDQQRACQWGATIRCSEIIECIVSTLPQFSQVHELHSGDASTSFKRGASNDWRQVLIKCYEAEDEEGSNLLIDAVRSVAQLVVSTRFGDSLDDYSPVLGGAWVCDAVEFYCRDLVGLDGRAKNPEVPGLYSSFEGKCTEYSIWFAQTWKNEERTDVIARFSEDCIPVFRPLVSRLSKALEISRGDILRFFPRVHD